MMNHTFEPWDYQGMFGMKPEPETMIYSDKCIHMHHSHLGAYGLAIFGSNLQLLNQGVCVHASVRYIPMSSGDNFLMSSIFKENGRANQGTSEISRSIESAFKLKQCTLYNVSFLCTL